MHIYFFCRRVIGLCIKPNVIPARLLLECRAVTLPIQEDARLGLDTK